MQIPQLTFLRFVAAFWVVVLHFGRQAWPMHTETLAPLAAQGALGVSFFFTLSGFLLAWVYGRHLPLDCKAYLRARFARVVPLYWISLGFGILVWGMLDNKWPSLFYGALQFTGLYAWWPDYSLTINFPAWSVSVELFLYATLPFLLPWMLKQNIARLLMVAFVLWLGTALAFSLLQGKTNVWFNDPFDLFLLRFPLWHLNTFFIGLVGGLLFHRNAGILRFKPWLPLAVSGFGVAVVLLTCYLPNPFIGIAHNGLLAPFFLMVIVGVASDKGWLTNFLSRKPMVFLGEISFALYIFQAPVQQVFIEFWLPEGAKTLNAEGFAVYTLCLLIFSALMYRLVETPLRYTLRGKSAPKNVALATEPLEAQQNRNDGNTQQ
jgi:peptidoglycan/LPS O-acetylase OafA/YrhL